jgi:hypothetical protein
MYGYTQNDKVSADVARTGEWEREIMILLLSVMERARKTRTEEEWAWGEEGEVEEEEREEGEVEDTGTHTDTEQRRRRTQAQTQAQSQTHPQPKRVLPRRKDILFIDIGGNLGAHTLCMSTAGFSTITFEPMKTNIRAIREGILATDKEREEKRKEEEEAKWGGRSLFNFFAGGGGNGKGGGEEREEAGIGGRIALIEKGLGEKEQTCTLLADKVNFGDGITRCVDVTDTDTQTQEEQGEGEGEGKVGKGLPVSLFGGSSDNVVQEESFPVTTLDAALYCPPPTNTPTNTHPHTHTHTQPRKIGALKMDIEGFEQNVVQGGQLFLNHTHIPAIAHENGGMPFAKRQYLMNFFVSLGYFYINPRDVCVTRQKKAGEGVHTHTQTDTHRQTQGGEGEEVLQEKVECFNVHTDAIFDAWDLVWVRGEFVEEVLEVTGRKRWFYTI